jgi:uncharacterized protein with HEPN domain
VNERDADRVDLILELIDHIVRRTEGLSRDQFLQDRDEVDLTAFRLAAIGEEASKLTTELKAAYPDIEWKAIYAMRNVVVHDYGTIDPKRVWQVLGGDLDALREVCRALAGK